MSTSEIWTTGTENQQASSLGRHIGRTQPSGWTTRRIGYFNRHGERIVRTWSPEGDMIETNEGKTVIT